MLTEQQIIELAKLAGFDIDEYYIYDSDLHHIYGTEQLIAFSNALHAEFIKSLVHVGYMKKRSDDITEVYALPNDEAKS